MISLIRTGPGTSPRSKPARHGSALLGALLLALAIAPEDAGAVSRLSITSFSVDRTLQRGRTTSVQPFCRRGFALLSTRFNVTAKSANTADPRNRPVVKVLGAVPTPKGAKFTFQNSGAPALIRATADCARIGSSGKLAARGAKASKAAPKLTTSVLEKTTKVKRGSGALRAAATKKVKLKLACKKKNSIPGDIGFDGGELAGASFFQKKGDIGVKANLRADRGDRASLYLTCVKGKRMKLKGKLAGKRRSATGKRPASVAAKPKKKPKVVVSYGHTSGAEQSDVPFPGAKAFSDQTPRGYWTPPVPRSVPQGALWAVRALADPAQGKAARGGLAPSGALNGPEGDGRGPGGELELIGLTAFFFDIDLEDSSPLRLLEAAAIVGVSGKLQVDDKRVPDEIPNFEPLPPVSADMSISKTASPSPARVGQDLTYTVTLRNNGPGAATGVRGLDRIPDEVTFKRATPSRGGPCEFAVDLVDCPIGEMKKGATVTIKVVVKVNSRPADGTITNLCSVFSDDDPNSENNHCTLDTPVSDPGGGAACADSKDNDGDNKVDMVDPGCFHPDDQSEQNLIGAVPCVGPSAGQKALNFTLRNGGTQMLQHIVVVGGQTLVTGDPGTEGSAGSFLVECSGGEVFLTIGWTVTGTTINYKFFVENSSGSGGGGMSMSAAANTR